MHSYRFTSVCTPVIFLIVAPSQIAMQSIQHGATCSSIVSRDTSLTFDLKDTRNSELQKKLHKTTILHQIKNPKLKVNANSMTCRIKILNGSRNSIFLTDVLQLNSNLMIMSPRFVLILIEK